jgi:ABC-2 type transport system permease protein
VPGAILVVWGALALFVVVAFLGQLLGLPEWVRNLSPFEHVPLLPAADLDATPLLALTAIAAALLAGGLAAFRHRDIG